MIFNPPIASVFFIAYVATGGKLPPAVFQVLCQLETRFQLFSFAFFPPYPHQPRRTLHALVN